MSTRACGLVAVASLLAAGCSPTAPPEQALDDACYVETLTPADIVPGTPVTIGGWAYVPELGRTADAVAVRLVRADGLVYHRPLYATGERPDVAKVLKRPGVNIRGFGQPLATDAFRPGRYAVTVVQLNAGRTYTCASPAVLSVR